MAAGAPEPDRTAQAGAPADKGQFVDELTLTRRIIWWVCWIIWGLGPRTFFRQRPRGVGKLPREGPFLLLANHTSFFDPAWVAWHCWRPTNFMASAQLFRVPVLGTLTAWLGAFPKVKFVKDRESMATLHRRYELGQPVVLFPEGERTWDGRQLTVLPGIARLIKRLDARVVYCRIKTGHLQQPRWARYPRFLPVELEYDGPHTYAPDMDHQAIVEDVKARLRVDPLPPVPRLSFGWRLAHGLPDLLWACPSCLVMEGLAVDPSDGDVVRCGACDRAWRVGLGNRLSPESPDSPALDVPRAVDILRDAFGDPPIEDRQRFEADGTVLSCELMTVGEIPRGERTPRLVARGPARLTPRQLEVRQADGTLSWAMPLEQLVAVSTEIANVLQIRDGQKLYQLDPGGQSTIKWDHFLKPWRENAGSQDD